MSDLCPVCKKAIPAWAPSGNCPACLFGNDETEAENTEEPQPSRREKVGDWELHERIGEGAFGVVFAAEQTRPVRRAAALKILRPGMATKEVLARFEAESQALALLNHPDIVTIYDAGTTDDGRPFFAMEFVPGVTITKFAAGLSIPQKLTLFDRICAVVEHAHQRGIIHRDLKPGNILVYKDDNGNPVLKLLDFGIAKATDHVLTEATILTGEGHFLGTPEYMSPEQTADVDVDTRSDVYSLGIILFELLVGHPPFVLSSNSLEVVLKFLGRVREETARPPSELSTKEIAKDLDWIVGKTIEKDRNRRYQSVSDLRDDLRRYSGNKPIKARPPDTIYIARKFLRRHWKLTTALTVIALSVITAAVVSSIMAVKTREAMRETQSAYSRSDLQSAVGELERDNITQAIGHLTRSLRTDPENHHAAMLLRATLDQFPLASLEEEEKFSAMVIPAAYFSSPQGNFVTVNEIGEVRFYDFKGRQEGPESVLGGTNPKTVISDNSKYLALGNIQGDVAVINLESREFTKLEELNETVLFTDLAFSHDGGLLCATTSDKRIWVWDTQSKKTLWKHTLPSAGYSIAFSNRQERIVVAGLNGERFDFGALSGTPLTDIPQQKEPVRHLVESGSGFRYYTVSSTGVIAAVDPGRAPIVFTEVQVDVPIINSAQDPDRRLTAYVSENEINVWTVLGKTITRRRTLPDTPTAITLHPKESLIYIGMEKRGIQAWDFERNRQVGTRISKAKNTVAIQISPDDNQLRCITRDGRRQVYHLPEDKYGEEDRSTGLPESWNAVELAKRNPYLIQAGHMDLPPLEDLVSTPRSIGCSRDQSLIFAGFRDNSVRVWNAKTGQLIRKIPTVTNSIHGIDISPDGRHLIYHYRFGRLSICDLNTGDVRVHAIGGRRDISSIVFSPDGTLVGVGAGDGSVHIWDAKTGSPVTEPLQHDVRGKLGHHFCRFSTDGKTLISWGSGDRAFRLWDVASGSPIGNPITFGKNIPKLAFFDPEDKFLTLITERKDGSVIRLIWSIESSLPVTPEIIIDPQKTDFSSIRLHSSAPIPEAKLSELEQLIGQR